MAWVVLLAAGGVVVAAGTVLAWTGAAIADRARISHAWTGALLIAGATSLPELATDTSAIIRDAPELATGDLFGSNMANMAILAMVALAFPRARVLAREAVELVIAASVAIILTATASLFVVARPDASVAGSFSVGSLVLVAVFVGAMLLPGFRGAIGEVSPPDEARAGARRWPVAVIAGFACSAIAILAVAPVLVASAEEIVSDTGLEATFVGVLMLALATSLPELSVSLAAVRSGDLDLAVGNLYGSNAINMLILVWLDAIYTRDPLLDTAHLSNAAAGMAAVLLMMVGLTGMALRAERRRFPVDPSVILILAGYVGGVWLVWSAGSHST